MTWPPYPACRDSGSDWIGSIPDTWRTAQLKRVATRITDGAHVSPETDGGVYDFVSTRDVGERGIDFEGSLKTTPASYDYLVRNGCQPTPGDVLFSKDGTIGRTTVVATDHPFVVASSLIIIKPNRREVIPGFLHYVCQSTSVLDQVDSFVRGAGLPRLSIANLTKIIAAFPPVGEQGQIVRFLDRETDKIDALIGKQEQLIATLREDRTATITHAVTKGLEADAQMKGTNVAWLRQIPANWEIRPVKSYGKLITGKTPPSEDLANFSDNGLPWIRPQDIDQYRGITVPSAGISQSGLQHINRIPADSVLVCCIGAGSIGKVGYSQHAACTNQQITTIAGVHHPQYLFYLMLAAKDQILSFAAINRLPIINNERLGSIQVPFPSLGEMAKIADYLDGQCGKIDTLIAKATEVIETLREYRSALITDAVTGKIDVRGAA